MLNVPKSFQVTSEKWRIEEVMGRSVLLENTDMAAHGTIFGFDTLF